MYSYLAELLTLKLPAQTASAARKSWGELDAQFPCCRKVLTCYSTPLVLNCLLKLRAFGDRLSRSLTLQFSCVSVSWWPVCISLFKREKLEADGLRGFPTGGHRSRHKWAGPGLCSRSTRHIGQCGDHRVSCCHLRTWWTQEKLRSGNPSRSWLWAARHWQNKVFIIHTPSAEVVMPWECGCRG